MKHEDIAGSSVFRGVEHFFFKRLNHELRLVNIEHSILVIQILIVNLYIVGVCVCVPCLKHMIHHAKNILPFFFVVGFGLKTYSYHIKRFGLIALDCSKILPCVCV